MSNTDAIHLICKTFENHQSINEIRRSFTESAPPTQSKTQAFASFFRTCEKAFKKHRPEKIYRYR